ncbi:putative phosphatase regulatory subunit domain containing protein [Lactarius tabidus]
MPYVSVATHLRVGETLRSPVLITLDALARSQLDRDDPLTRRLSAFLHPQSKYDLQKRRPCTPTRRVSSPTAKPLKSSLKCSRGLSVISEPNTPLPRSPSHSPPPSPKSVHFKDEDGELESVRLFRPTGRPSYVSRPHSHSDTETETETDSSFTARQCSGTMFTTMDIPPIPSLNTPPKSKVHLESLTLLPARPPLLRGIVRVRNISFEKCVAVRFTTDGWTTVSETQARFVGPAPETDGAWDLFAFTTPVQAPRKIHLAVRYTVPGIGEWWDNNGGADFRIVLTAVHPAPPCSRQS